MGKKLEIIWEMWKIAPKLKYYQQKLKHCQKIETLHTWNVAKINLNYKKVWNLPKQSFNVVITLNIWAKNWNRKHCQKLETLTITWNVG